MNAEMRKARLRRARKALALSTHKTKTHERAQTIAPLVVRAPFHATTHDDYTLQAQKAPEAPREVKTSRFSVQTRVKGAEGREYLCEVDRIMRPARDELTGAEFFAPTSVLRIVLTDGRDGATTTITMFHGRLRHLGARATIRDCSFCVRHADKETFAKMMTIVRRGMTFAVLDTHANDLKHGREKIAKDEERYCYEDFGARMRQMGGAPLYEKIATLFSEALEKYHTNRAERANKGAKLVS